jgi:hypothetical protein
MDLDVAINAFATAIAYAEGFYVNGSRPQRNNNPGDLTLDTIGKGIGKDGPFIIYATPDDGWEALKRQVSLILTNTSNVYNTNMTIQDMANRYTTTEQEAWALNVAGKLGVSPDTKISTILETAAIVGGGGAILFLVALVLYLRNKV